MHRPWTDEEITKLRSMAQRYPARTIAAELGRGVFAVAVKAHQLRLSLKVKSKAQEPLVDPGGRARLGGLLEPITRSALHD